MISLRDICIRSYQHPQCLKYILRAKLAKERIAASKPRRNWWLLAYRSFILHHLHELFWHRRSGNLASIVEIPTHCTSRWWNVRGTLRTGWCWIKIKRIAVDPTLRHVVVIVEREGWRSERKLRAKDDKKRMIPSAKQRKRTSGKNESGKVKSAQC